MRLMKNATKPVKAFIFDFDLTLADSTESVVDCSILTLSQLGFGGADEKKIKKTIGMTLENSFLFLTGTDDAVKAREYKAKYIANADSIGYKTVWMKGAREAVVHLKSRGIKTAIVSTKIRRRITGFLEMENMLDMFDVITGGDDVTNNKPDPEGLVMTIGKLGVTNDEALYTGDSTVDQETAYNAGVKFAAVLTGVTKKKDFDGGKVFGFMKNICLIDKFI
jgi:phosphoglycolate phosphatase